MPATFKHEKRFRLGRKRALSAGPRGTSPDNIRLAAKTAPPWHRQPYFQSNTDESKFYLNY
jgi:hypothetical protein